MKITAYAIHETEMFDIQPGNPDRDWMDKFHDRHPYRCLPLIIANTTGWEIRSPCSFTATWTGGPRMEDIRLDADDDYEGLHRFVASHFTEGVLTFHTSYLFRTEPGWDIFVSGAPNHTKDGIFPLTGIVETSWLPFPFTMNWRFTRPGPVSFKKGEPFAFILPVPHDGYEDVQPEIRALKEDPQLEREYHAWAQSRTGFLDKLSAKDAEAIKQGWQKHYFKGQKVEGEGPGDQHVNRRRLKKPIRVKPEG